MVLLAPELKELMNSLGFTLLDSDFVDPDGTRTMILPEFIKLINNIQWITITYFLLYILFIYVSYITYLIDGLLQNYTFYKILIQYQYILYINLIIRYLQIYTHL